MAADRKAAPSGPVVLVRLALGAIAMARGARAIRSEAPGAEALEAAVQGATGILGWWGDTVVLAQPGAAAFGLAWGSVALGALLFLGAFVRPVGVLGALLALQLVAFGTEAERWFGVLAAVCALACVAANAGQRLGLDARRGGRSFLD